jgi:hypothetical protein
MAEWAVTGVRVQGSGGRALGGPEPQGVSPRRRVLPSRHGGEHAQIYVANRCFWRHKSSSRELGCGSRSDRFGVIGFVVQGVGETLWSSELRGAGCELCGVFVRRGEARLSGHNAVVLSAAG